MYRTSHLRAWLFICDKMGRCKSYFSSNWQDRCLIIANCRRLNFPALAFPTQKVSADSIIIPPRLMLGFSRRRQTRYKTRCLGNKEWPQVCRCQAFRQSRSPRPEASPHPPRTYFHTTSTICSSPSHSSAVAAGAGASSQDALALVSPVSFRRQLTFQARLCRPPHSTSSCPSFILQAAIISLTANYLFIEVMGAKRAATRGLQAGCSLTVRTASFGQQCLNMAGAPNQA